PDGLRSSLARRASAFGLQISSLAIHCASDGRWRGLRGESLALRAPAHVSLRFRLSLALATVHREPSR
ncbi:hypothetical protein, partial [Alicyclobacillus fructus]|uniref:hypothetical protein n=1 Tax=Alicyclobacillus fructus TaxID=2816082 RepID=UPI001A8C7F2C